jgi:hypothetical protein
LEIHDLNRFCFFEQPINIGFLIFNFRTFFIFRRRRAFLSWTLCTNFWNMKLGLKERIPSIKFAQIMEQRSISQHLVEETFDGMLTTRQRGLRIC